MCDRNMKFTYVLIGWEGLVADARVLRDDVTKNLRLKVPKGNYYLCDNGYTNAEGFLTPYKEMDIDPMEHLLDDQNLELHREDEVGVIENVESTRECSNWRDELASNMFNEWRSRRLFI
ncbi:hypothetical protein Sango_1168900 [Sesamum angolense]|uniref:DDE Tnp4 domain-containing protein n=1 Tax=Sesamum angolense TaxID=2727404 RepID=A0AAE1WVS7_9LAMI|nr:hypothetical protein Sango_1168900 [Sesamum angolense]